MRRPRLFVGLFLRVLRNVHGDAVSTREPCGCKHDGRKWLELCPTHRAEFDERHEMAHAEHLARQPEGTYFYAVPGLHSESVTPVTDAPSG